MYAEHVLRVRVDWSSLIVLHGQKFGGIGIALTKCTVPDIPYTPVPEWFRKNHELVDEPGTPIPEGRTPKKPRQRKRQANDVEMAIEEAFEHMDEGMEANVEINNLINEVVNEVNLGEGERTPWRAEWKKCVSNMPRKFIGIKQRFFIWKIKLQHLRWERLAVQVVHQLHQQFNLWKQRGTQEEAKIAKSQALEVCMRNEVMREKMEALQNEVVDMQQQLQVVNEVIVDHLDKIDGLAEQNARLKKFLLDVIVERKNLRTYILFFYGQGSSI